MFEHRDNRTGQQLGHYRLLRPLVRAHLANIYLGEHVLHHTRVMLKLFHVRLHEEDSEDFLQEVRMLTGLDHPHLLHILDGAVENGTPFLVMEGTTHDTLRHRHPPGTRVDSATILMYLKHLAPALRYIHEQRLIHRNIQPESMIPGDEETLVLGSFGLAFLAHHTIAENTQALVEAVGEAVAYMAPEQLRGMPQPASDQYSLAVVVYEWLCGRRPFAGSPEEIIEQQFSAEPPSLREYVPELDSTLDAVVLKALSKDPHQRFASVQDFFLALEQAFRQE